MAGRLDSTPDLTHKVRGIGTGVAYSYMCASNGCGFKSVSSAGWGAISAPFGRLKICPTCKEARDARIAARKAKQEGGAQ